MSAIPRVLLLVVFASSVIGPWASLATAQAQSRFVDVDRAIEAERKKQGVVGLAIGIIRNRRVVYTQGYGYADRESKSPVSTDSVFNWASNSKPLAAVAAIQLVEQGVLDLDADIRTYVPEYPDPGAVITTRQLLCHQSGIPHYRNGRVVGTEAAGSFHDSTLDPILSLNRFNRSPLLFPPGTKEDYSSYAYVLLSAVIQRAGKAPFTDQVQKRIRRPLSLKSLQLDEASSGHEDWVQGYYRSSNNRVAAAAEEAHAWKLGAGGYKSNIKDFAAWAAALLDNEFLPRPLRKKLWEPQPLKDGKATEWGLGFVVENQGELKISHNGSQTESTTRMVLYPESGAGVVVMTNCEFGKPGEFSTAVFQALK